MNTRPRARAQKSTPTTVNRSRGLADLVNLKVRLSDARIKVYFACRAFIPPCPDVHIGPPTRSETVFVSFEGPDSRAHLAPWLVEPSPLARPPQAADEQVRRSVADFARQISAKATEPPTPDAKGVVQNR